MTFATPLWLLLLLVLPLLIWQYGRTVRGRYVSLQVPLAYALGGRRTWRTQLRRTLPIFRWSALGFLAVGMARPQRLWQEEKIKAEAVDIVLAMDISPSMLTKDFQPDRLAVSKSVAVHFVEKRPHDRLGLVAFSAEAFTQCPLTSDRKVVETFIQSLQIGKLEDGTAIGMGLATAVNRLKDSPAASKIVILLTDGENNAGYIQPLDAAEIARALDVRVYTIGIGTDGQALAPASRDPYTGQYEFALRETRLDTELLRKIAEMTDGKSYRAFDAAELENIYADIDKLEKTEIEVTTVQRKTELFHWFAGLAALLLCLEMLLRWVFLRSLT
ncbi:MAG: vWA domain-containing protein [Saprospiraceae bacterium]